MAVTPKHSIFLPNTATFTRQMYIFSAKGTSKLACCLMVCDTSQCCIWILILQKNVPTRILSSSTPMHWVSRRFHMTSSDKMGWIHVVRKFNASTLRHNTLLQLFQILYASKVHVLQLLIKFHLLCMLSEAILNPFTWISYLLEPNMNFTLQVDCVVHHRFINPAQSWILRHYYTSILLGYVTDMLIIYL